MAARKAGDKKRNEKRQTWARWRKKRIIRVETHALLSIKGKCHVNWRKYHVERGKWQEIEGTKYLVGRNKGVISYEDEATIIWEGAVLRIRIRIYYIC